MMIKNNFDDVIETKKIEREISIEQVVETIEEGNGIRKRMLRLVALLLVLSMVVGSFAGAYYYGLTHQLAYRDFTVEATDYTYVDERFNITSNGILDDLNMDAVNGLYYRYDRILEMMDHPSMPQIDIIFYDDLETYKAVCGEFIGDAFYSNGVIHVLNLKANENLRKSDYYYREVILTHEFVHAVHHD